MQLRSSLSVSLKNVLASVIHSIQLPFFPFTAFFHLHCKATSTNTQLTSSSSPLFLRTAFHCSMALGMESGKISDDQITSSTSFYDNRWLPRQARLNNDDNAWTPSEDSNKEYIQVECSSTKSENYDKDHTKTISITSTCWGQRMYRICLKQQHLLYSEDTHSMEIEELWMDDKEVLLRSQSFPVSNTHWAHA